MKKVLVLILAIGLMLSSAFSQEKSPLKVAGVFFGDYFYNVARDTGISTIKNTVVNGAKELNGFSIRRIQVAFIYEFSDKIISKIRLESDGAVLNSNSSYGLFIKDAYLQFGDILPGMNLLAGMQSTPATEFAESIWGYRCLDRTIIDSRGFLGTRDLGVSVRGKFDKEGNFGYALLFGNNSGTKPETDRNKRLYGTFTFKPIDGLAFAISSDMAWKNADQNTITSSFTGGYLQKDVFSVGLDAFYITQANTLLNTDPVPQKTAPLNSLGLSVFGNVFFTPDLSLVLRCDYYQPNMNSEDKYKLDPQYDPRTYIIAGLSYMPIKNVKIIPNVQYEMYSTGKSPNGSDRKYDPSITARITFEFKFEK
jgi:hypothetical protein